MVSKALQLQVTKNKLEFDALQSFLIKEEPILASQGKIKLSQGTSMKTKALHTHTNKKKRIGCYKCRKHGHFLAMDCPTKDSQKGKHHWNSSRGRSISASSSSSRGSSWSTQSERGKLIGSTITAFQFWSVAHLHCFSQKRHVGGERA